MKRLKTLQKNMSVDQLLITDAMMLKYYTGHSFDVGERLIACLVTKHDEPILFLNKLFEAPQDMKLVHYEDSDNPIALIKEYLNEGTLAIDGNWPARFVIPFVGAYTLENASPILEAMRTIKDDNEQDIMRRASAHNDRIMGELKDAIRIGMTEKELAAIAFEKQSTDPLSGPSFTPITVFSENIADPHGIPSDRQLKDGDVVLIDMGGFYEGYASDMTRCFVVGHNEKLEAIYDIVRQANEQAIAQVKPGVRFCDIDKAARDVITNAGYGEFFIHRTGHGIGMETHENLDVSASNTRLVEAGMCFSIEPGIYLPGIGGIRVEDLVIVTDDACEVINHYPKDLQRITF